MSFCPKCHAPVSEDVRPVATPASEVFDLYQGARYRSFSEAQIEYLRGCIGITWAKAFRAGEVSARAAQAPRIPRNARG